jgi:hypothetical protein
MFSHPDIFHVFSYWWPIMENQPVFRPNPDLKLMDQVREVLRYYHYAYRTEQSYCDWILRYVRFHGGQTHPKDLGTADVTTVVSPLDRL